MCFRDVQSIVGDGVRRHTGFGHYGLLVLRDERRPTKWPVSALLSRRSTLPFSTLNAAFSTRLLKKGGSDQTCPPAKDTLSALTSATDARIHPSPPSRLSLSLFSHHFSVNSTFPLFRRFRLTILFLIARSTSKINQRREMTLFRIDEN